MSCIDALVNRRDVIVYDAEAHACIVDGVRLHMGHRYAFKHNDIQDCENNYNGPPIWPKRMVAGSR